MLNVKVVLGYKARGNINLYTNNTLTLGRVNHFFNIKLITQLETKLFAVTHNK